MSSGVKVSVAGSVRKPVQKSALKDSSAKQEKHRLETAPPQRPTDEYVFTIADIWNASKVPRAVLRELIREVSIEIHNRGK